jgi:hypothetical protein
MMNVIGELLQREHKLKGLNCVHLAVGSKGVCGAPVTGDSTSRLAGAADGTTVSCRLDLCCFSLAAFAACKASKRFRLSLLMPAIEPYQPL